MPPAAKAKDVEEPTQLPAEDEDEPKEEKVPESGRPAVEYALTHFPTQPVRVDVENEGHVNVVEKLAAEYGRTTKLSQPTEYDTEALEEGEDPVKPVWPALVEIAPADAVNGVQHVRMGK